MIAPIFHRFPNSIQPDIKHLCIWQGCCRPYAKRVIPERVPSSDFSLYGASFEEKVEPERD